MYVFQFLLHLLIAVSIYIYRFIAYSLCLFIYCSTEDSDNVHTIIHVEVNVYILKEEIIMENSFSKW